MNSRKGFTLMEMVIVLAIISILAATAYPRIAGYMEVKKEQYRVNQEYIVNKALKQYYAFTGGLPLELSDNVLDSGELDSFFSDINSKTSVSISKGDYTYSYDLAAKKIIVSQ